MIEKRKSSYSLEKIKAAFRAAEDLNMTYSAMQGQYELGFTDQDVVDAIQSLTLKNFYKSMSPNHKNFSEWQDVYKSVFKGIELYMKFQVSQKGKIIVSFKRR